MKAVTTPKYGPPEVMKVVEMDKPVPAGDEVLINVCASSVSTGDCRARSFNVPLHVWLPARIALGIFRPRAPVQGLWITGVVEEAGEKAALFKPGDRICANTISAGMRFGGYAEYASLPEKSLMTRMPDGLSFEEAVSIPFGALSALYFLRKGNIGMGKRLLVHGASGAVGSAAVQLAAYYGARVDGVCSSVNVELVRSLGADRVFDYTREDFARNGGKYDIVFDAAGKAIRSECNRALAPGGMFVSVISSGHVDMRLEDLDFVFDLAGTGRIRPVMDRSYPLERLAEAHAYVELGHKKGNVTVTNGVCG